MTSRNRRTLLAASLLAGYAGLQFRGRAAGSTAAERRRVLPGDDLVGVATVVTDHAITVAAPPERIWPWLTQVGWHRAGWYTPRWVDRLLFPANLPSLGHLDAALVRDLAPGDTIADGPPGTAFFRVEQVAEPRHLVLRSTTHVPGSWGRRLGASIDWTWTFALDPTDDGGTRVHLRVRGRTRPWWLTAAYRAALVPADAVMGPGMLRGLRRRAGPLDRIGADDLMQLASDVGPAPMNVGAVVVLGAGSAAHLPAVEGALARRVLTVPRLRQRLVRLAPGLGRPLWVDDGSFDLARHVCVVPCPEPGGRQALMDLAMGEVTRPLPRDRPLWRAVFVTGLHADRVALVLVLHHVLVDGIGGLALLTTLVDDTARAPSETGRSRPQPTTGNLIDDALAARYRAVRQAPRALRRLWAARTELGFRGVRLAPRCSLNAPTGATRRATTVRADLAQLREVAHRHGATVNDVVLVAVTGALTDLLTDVGEQVPELVVSVPVSARSATSSADLGNAVGVMPVHVPLTGPGDPDLAQVAALTRAQKLPTRGSSAAVIGPAFRMLAALGVLRSFVERQRLVNTFLTDMRGPAEAMTFAGVPVDEVVPATVTAGNVTVAFAALSYAGTLTIAVIVDPGHVPDPAVAAEAVGARLQALGVAVDR